MEAPTDPGRLTLLDACAVISLFASRRMADIIGAMPTPCGVVDLVRDESLYVFAGGANDAADAREVVDLDPLVHAGLVHVVAPTEDELEAFVDLALQVDDGEAMTAAIAIARGWTVVTDERKASRLLSNRVEVRTTLELIKAWADAGGIDAAVVRTVLTDVRTRGSYFPGRTHPLKTWWDSLMDDS